MFSMTTTSKTQLEQIKQIGAVLSGDQKKKYLSGLRDSADFAQVLCDENKKFDLAADPTFRALLDYLDSQS